MARLVTARVLGKSLSWGEGDVELKTSKKRIN